MPKQTGIVPRAAVNLKAADRRPVALAVSPSTVDPICQFRSGHPPVPLALQDVANLLVKRYLLAHRRLLVSVAAALARSAMN